MHNNNTGILFFSRHPLQEAQIKKLSGCKENNAKIWQQLYSKSITAARKTGFPVTVCDTNIQYGNNFSDRLINAIQDSFAKGWKHLIILGSDCPGITSLDIIETASLLNNGADIVAGPDQRGGVYLLGISREAFRVNDLSGLRWQSSYLLSDLECYSTNLSFVCRQVKYHDIHTCGDAIASIAAGNIYTWWKKLVITTLLSFKQFYGNYFLLFKSRLAIANLSLRAPPCTA